MKIKGNLGDKVLLSGIIKKVMISESGVEYSCCVEGHDFSFWCTEDEIEFQLEEIPFDEDPSLPVDDEWSRPLEVTREETETNEDENETDGDSGDWFEIEQRPKKKRGRPRKATVEDLMKRAKE